VQLHPFQWQLLQSTSVRKKIPLLHKNWVAAEETPHCDCTYQDEATCDSKLCTGSTHHESQQHDPQTHHLEYHCLDKPQWISLTCKIKQVVQLITQFSLQLICSRAPSQSTLIHTKFTWSSFMLRWKGQTWCARWEHSLNNFTVLAHSNGFCRTQENNQ
jgi:hypothetical protein